MKTTVIGSYPKIPNYPREERVRIALHQFDRKEITKEQLDKVFDEVTIECMREMEEAGIDVITDGQIRYMDEVTYFAQGCRNVTITGLKRYFNNNTLYREPLITGPIEWKEPITVKDFVFAKKHARKPLKAVLPGPHTLAFCSKDEYYKDFHACAYAYAEALNKEMNALVNAGATEIELTEPAVEHFSPDIVDRAFKGIRAKRDLVSYFYDVPKRYFDVTSVEALGLDFVESTQNVVHIEHGLLGDRELLAGVVDARNTKLETREMIEPLIKRLLSHVPKERITLCPNAGLDYLPREDAFEKLKNLVRIAQQF